jgi:transposase-like protein
MTLHAPIVSTSQFRLIVAIDANSITQLVAYAIIPNETADALKQFLSRVREKMGDRFPRAFMVDRAESEKSAISEVFPESHICFCQMHIFRNMQVTLGRASNAVAYFWSAMKDHGLAKAYRRTRQSLQTSYRQRADNKHWASSETSAYTEVDTSARIEVFFGRVKTMLDHEISTFMDVATAFRILGEIAFNTSLNQKPLSIPSKLMSIEDQQLAGRYVLIWLLLHHEADESGFALPAKIAGQGYCCPAHRLYQNFPCRHLLAERKQQYPDGPWFFLSDVPLRWQRFSKSDDSINTPRASHTHTRASQGNAVA